MNRISYHIQLFVLPRDLFHLANRNRAAEELFRRQPVRLDGAVEKTAGRKVDVHIDGFGHILPILEDVKR